MKRNLIFYPPNPPNPRLKDSPFLQFLIRQPFVPVLQVDDAAVAEAVLQQDVLHDAVVAMGIRPQIGHLRIAPLQAGGGQAMGVCTPCQTVDGAIGLCIVQPLPVVDAGIGGVCTHNEGKGAHGLAGLVQAEVTVAVGDVLLHNIFSGIAMRPLVQVATAAHDAPSPFIEVHQDGKVSRKGMSDLYHTLQFNALSS